MLDDVYGTALYSSSLGRGCVRVARRLLTCCWDTTPLEWRRAMATLQDRFNINSQLEHLQAKYVGTGHADLGRFEWAVNVHRDSYASYIGHHPLVSYFAIAENESVGRKKYDLMQKMLLPCGFPPAREEEVE
ncbi:hypothetical protein ABBQ38_004326 [Trebouxia sp. C0009 RCD-2024]